MRCTAKLFNPRCDASIVNETLGVVNPRQLVLRYVLRVPSLVKYSRVGDPRACLESAYFKHILILSSEKLSLNGIHAFDPTFAAVRK